MSSLLTQKIDRFRQVLAAEPESRAYVPLADLLRQSGQYDEALVLLEEGLSRNPEHQSAMVVLGLTLLQAGRQDHGVKVLQRVLEMSPDNFVVLRTLSESFLERQAFTHAIPILERLADLEPDQKQWSEKLVEARDQLQSERTRQQKAETAENDPAPAPINSQDFATLTLVDIMISQGYLDKALAALEKIEEREPGRAEVLERLERLRSGDMVGGPPSDNQKQEEASRAELRARQKEQFGGWIDRLKSDNGQAS